MLEFSGLLKKSVRKIPELKVIITSATLDIRKFSEYFNAPMVKIPGKMYPVAVKYQISASRQGRGLVEVAEEGETKYVDAACQKVIEIHQVGYRPNSEVYQRVV